MERYIALLRGINVGGKNKIAMPLLKTAFEEQGFSEVKTYINSGNVLFSSPVQDKNKLIQIAKQAVADHFELMIPITIVALDELSEMLSHAPSWWNVDKESIHYAIFLIPPISADEVFAAVGEINPAYEQIAHHKNVIFWSAPLKTFAKARWSKIASSTANNQVTIQNANTVVKLLKLSQ